MLRARLGYLLLVWVIMAVCLIQTAVLVVQFACREIPCPLCLLQRLALFGIGFGLVMCFRERYSPAKTGCAMLSAVFLLVVSARQALNNIIPREGHNWVGGTLSGLHLPVWSVMTALFMLVLLAFSVVLLPQEKQGFSVLEGFGKRMAGYLWGLCLLNVVMVMLQCGSGICHTYGYRLLGQAG